MFNYREIPQDKCDFVEVADEGEIGNGERLYLEIGEKAIVLFNIGGELYAIEDECSHDGNPLGDGELAETVITCPRHGAQFDVTTGKVLSLPAVEDIPAYPIRIVEGKIQIGLPKE